MSKFLFLSIIVLLSTLKCSAQKLINEEFGFKTDNDLYVSFYLDEYYTNGLELYYRKAKASNFLKFNKSITAIKVGQKIYNPFGPNVKSLFYHDRPFAGYTYGQFSKLFTNTKNIISIALEIGYTGKKTGAEEAQNFVHKFYNINEAQGWEHQIKQEIGYAIKANYTRNLVNNKNSKFQISSINKINLGTLISNLNTGLAIKIRNSSTSKTEISNSLFYETSLEIEKNTWVKEKFWGIKSYVNYQISDKTITGDLYNNYLNKQFNIIPWAWFNEIAYYWNFKRWNFSYHQIFHTKSNKKINDKWIRYGSLQLSYKF